MDVCYLPTQQQIEQACAGIQRAWSSEDQELRARQAAVRQRRLVRVSQLSSVPLAHLAHGQFHGKV